MASLSNARRLVVKVGSALLVERDTRALRHEWLAGLAADVADLRAAGIAVVLVSSGSIALGRGVLNLAEGPLSLEQSQAAAAVGQIQLARAYEEALQPYGLVTAQILLTLDDSANRRRYLNIRATMHQLLKLGAIPIVNENDTVATDEIRFGDNDRLAAQVALAVGADQLVLLSDVDGLYTADPGLDPDAEHLSEIAAVTPEIEAMAGDPISGLSKGGMKTKVMAAKTATSGGCAMAIAEGRGLRPLTALMNGAPASWFLPELDPTTARKSWISAMKTRGAVSVDAGAVRALGRGKSLLPAGITKVEGRFQRGDLIEIRTPEGLVLGVGLTRYALDETRRIIGLRSDQIEQVLGYPGRAALIHRDDMVL